MILVAIIISAVVSHILNKSGSEPVEPEEEEPMTADEVTEAFFNDNEATDVTLTTDVTVHNDGAFTNSMLAAIASNQNLANAMSWNPAAGVEVPDHSEEELQSREPEPESKDPSGPRHLEL